MVGVCESFFPSAFGIGCVMTHHIYLMAYAPIRITCAQCWDHATFPMLLLNGCYAYKRANILRSIVAQAFLHIRCIRHLKSKIYSTVRCSFTLSTCTPQFYDNVDENCSLSLLLSLSICYCYIMLLTLCIVHCHM